MTKNQTNVPAPIEQIARDLVDRFFENFVSGNTKDSERAWAVQQTTEALHQARAIGERTVPELPSGCWLGNIWQTNKVFSCEVVTTKIVERQGLKQYERVGGYGLPTIQEACAVAISKIQVDL